MASQMASLGQQKRTLKEKWIWEGWERFPAASIIMAPELSCRALQDWIVFLNCDKGLFWFNTVLKRMISAWIYHPIGMKYTLQLKGLTSDLKCTLQHKGARMRSALRQGLHRNWSTVRAISVAAGSVKMKNNHKHRTTHTVMFIQYYTVKNVVVFFKVANKDYWRKFYLKKWLFQSFYLHFSCLTQCDHFFVIIC